MISVVIPSYKDPLLHKTIDSLLDNSEGVIEIIPVIDGYELKKPFREDKRIKPVILKKNVGMRGAINAGVSASHGKYIMRVDEHCMFGSGYDVKLLQYIHDNWIVTPRRYKLDAVKWEVMNDLHIDYEKLIIVQPRNKFASVPWRSRDVDRAHIMLDEKMAMQGSCWLMSRKHWDTVIKELQSEGYGTHYQDSIEMTFKTWKAGGMLMLNKYTWYAHKHRKFPRTHNIKRDSSDASFKYSLGIWGDYYKKVIKPRWEL